MNIFLTIIWLLLGIGQLGRYKIEKKKSYLYLAVTCLMATIMRSPLGNIRVIDITATAIGSISVFFYIYTYYKEKKSK